MIEEEVSYNNLTDEALSDVWQRFLTGYNVRGRYIYHEQITTLRQHSLRTLFLNYEHLTDYNFSVEPIFHMLRVMTIYDPDKARTTLKMAAFALLKDFDPEYADSIERSFRAEFTNAPLEKEMVLINIDDAGKFLKTTGLVTAYDDRSTSLVHSIMWVCTEGHPTRMYTSEKPKKCTVPIEGTDTVCGSTYFHKDEKRSHIEDYIRFNIQQRAERVLEAKAPADMEIEVIGPDNVGWIKKHLSFGQYVSVSGIVRTKALKRTSGQGKTIAELYMEGSYVDVLPDSYLLMDADPALDEVVKNTIRPDHEEEDLEKVIDSVVPSLYMSDRLIKELILMLLVGSDPLRQPDGTRIRGEAQILYIGDPGIGKSRIAEYIALVRPRVMYNSAGKSSSVGLVGGMVMDRDGVMRIKSGVFGLAKNGVVILDEFAGRPASDYNDLLEPLSDMQSVTIAKGAQYRKEYVNTSVLAIANPSTHSRYYNPNKSIYDNTEIPSTILQRFDCIVIRRDEAEESEDDARVKHFFENQSKAVTERDFLKERPDKVKRRKETYYGADYMKKWIEYVRETYHPRMSESPEAIKYVCQWYHRTRKMKITIGEEGAKAEGISGESVTIPASDMRKLGSITRFAQMHARASQRHEVTVEDAERACEYMDITLAEAGMWKQGESAVKEYAKDELAEHHRKIHEQWAQRERLEFQRVINNLSWGKCPECKKGEKIELGGEVMVCSNCNGVGWLPIAFSKNDAMTDLVGTGKGRMPLHSFNLIWNEWQRRASIIQYDDYGRFTNTEPYIPKSNKPIATGLDVAKKEMKDRLARNHPGHFKRLMGV